ncbi:MAG: ATP-binding protein [Aeriscardovia sp.]|nr:ATP-binding protein [Aeriscardovia sp.]
MYYCTETPYIYDKNYKFFLERRMIPRQLGEDFIGRDVDETLFELPFDKPDKNPEACHKAISSRLQNLSYPLLFLNHLKEIQYKVGAIEGYYQKKVEESQQFEDITAELICCTNEHGDTKSKDKLWLFTRSAEKGMKYSVGFFLGEKDDGKTCLRPVDMPAFCFFPTKEATGLHFIIQAPFLLTDSREGIRQDEPHNETMLQLLADLAAESIVLLKEIGEGRENHLVDDNILDIVPIKGTYSLDGKIHRKHYGEWQPFYVATDEVFKHKNIIPAKGGYASSTKAYWAEENKIADLFTDEQLSQLYNDDGSKWAFPSISRKAHGIAQEDDEARRAFIDLITDHKHPSESEILNKITPSFIEAQSILWLTQFYKWIDSSVSRRKKAKNLAIFLDGHGRAVTAFKGNGEPNLFLPSADIDEGEYAMLSPDLWNEDELKDFFKNGIGLAEPSPWDYIRKKISLYENDDNVIDIKRSYEDFKKFFAYYCDNPEDTRLISLLKECEFLAYRDFDGEVKLAKAGELYFPTPDLKKWFQASPHARLLCEDYKKIVGEEKEHTLKKFMDELGIKTKISIRYKEEARPEDIKYLEGTRYNEFIEPDIDGFMDFTESLTECLPFPSAEAKAEEKEKYDQWNQSRREKTRFLWNRLQDFLGESWRREGCWRTSNWYRGEYYEDKFYYGYSFPAGEYHWFKRRDHETSYTSKVQQRLKEIAWNFMIEDGPLSSAEKIDNCDPKLLTNFFDFKTLQESEPESEEQKIREMEKKLEGHGKDPKKLYKETLEKELKELEKETPKVEGGVRESFNKSYSGDILPEKGLTKSNSPTILRTDSNSETYQLVQPSQLSSFNASGGIESQDFTGEDDRALSQQSVSETIEKKQQKIQDEICRLENERERLEEMYGQVSQLPKYSFGWFKALLSLEKEGQEQNANGREISITFSSIKRDPKSDRSFILSQPNRYLPTSIEDKSNIPMSLFMRDGQKRSPEIEVVSVKGNALRVRAKNEDQLKGIDFSKVTHAVINVKNPDFLLESLDGEFQKLDYSDDFDMQQNLCENIEFLVGPPGTGKTTYLAKYLKTLMEGGEDSCKVLVLTPTNKAADVLVRKIMEISGEDDSYNAWLARIGMTEDDVVEKSPVFREKALDVQSMSKCVAATTIARYPYDYLIPGKGKTQPLKEIDWDYIVVDEASMISLADIAFLLYKQRPKKFIIAGDPFQIEPIVSQEAWKDKNIYSLVKLDSFDAPSTSPHDYDVKTLNRQYRSVPEVGDVFSNFSYGGKLEHYRASSERKNLQLEDLGVRALNIIKYPVRKYESVYRVKRLSGSPYQIYSALLTVEYVRFLAMEIAQRNPGQTVTIGIISPYHAQAQIIDRLLSREKLPDGIKVTSGTVHKFQGDECDIIFAVFNTPANISNPRNIHVDNQNILNVAVSRARDYLFVVMPDDETENIGSLRRLKRIENLMKEGGACSVTRACDIEKFIFGQSDYLENNVFSTGHQDVNVYGRPEKMYEVRTEEDAVDIQLHGPNFYS